MYSYNGTSATTHRALLSLYRSKFYESVAAGEIKPHILPYHTFGLFLLVAYLCIPHVGRPWIFAMRWPVLAMITAFELKRISETSSMGPGMGFYIGLAAAWNIVWSFTLLVWTMPQFDARRVKRGSAIVKDETEPSKQINGQATNDELPNAVDGLKLRLQQKGHTKDSNVRPEVVEDKNGKPSAAAEYYWQPYPKESFRERVDWVFDLVLNFRYVGWNWEISTNPGLPAKVKASLGEPIDFKAMKLKSHVGTRLFLSRSQLLMVQLPRLIIGYLLLDIAKVAMSRDPYFLIGPNDYPLPAHLASLSPLMLLLYRQLLVLFGVTVALEYIFLQVPFVLCVFIGPVIGVRGEAWMYPTTWGSLEIIYTTGLAGLWSGWWHQTFRFGFLAPSQYLVRNRYLSPRSFAYKIISLFIAFATSAAIHASGSVTQFINTIPQDQILFFLLQAVGIIIQIVFCSVFASRISKLSPQIRRAANFAFTFTWLFLTSPLLLDDFSRGGVWLFEPIPVSFLRGLGFGEEADRRWWVWDHWGIWYTGARNWWECGWAI